MRNIDTIVIKNKKFTLPPQRREILKFWESDENINNENLLFEKKYNTLPDEKKYIPKKIFDGWIGSIVVLTEENLVIKNAEISYYHDAKMVSIFTKKCRNAGSKILEYHYLPSDLLSCEYLEDYKSMENLSEKELLPFIQGITDSICKMDDKYSGVNVFSKEQLQKVWPTGLNMKFLKFLEFAKEKWKISTLQEEKVLKIYKGLLKLPQQPIHWDIGRNNILYKDNDFCIIDPKVNLGRVLEDLTFFVLKSKTIKTKWEDVLLLIDECKKVMNEQERKEFDNWIIIYAISMFSENIQRKKELTIVQKLESIIDYYL